MAAALGAAPPLEVGFDVPAAVGMAERDVQTPCLVLDMPALERNVLKLANAARRMGVVLRPHAKMHKSVDVFRLQECAGSVSGVCCQKVSEAEVFVRAGVKDVLVSNEVRDPLKITRLAKLARASRVSVCVDDPANAAELSAAAKREGTVLHCLVEIDCGHGRCGIQVDTVVTVVRAILAEAPVLTFAGIQAYQGAMQHLQTYEERRAKAEVTISCAKSAVELLKAENIDCPCVTGGGTGSFEFEGPSGVYTEIQCGSYAFMDADYGRLSGSDGKRLDETGFENSLFLLTSIMSIPKPGIAICDAGLKSQSIDSGLPVVFGDLSRRYTKCSDEHGEIVDPSGGYPED